MRLSFALVLLLPSFAFAQPTAAQKKETAKWILDRQAPDSGFYDSPHEPKTRVGPMPTLRATHDAVLALKYLGAELPNQEKHAAFVMKAYDAKTGGFTEPRAAVDGRVDRGSKPRDDVAVTSLGMVVAAELGIPREKYAKAMDYLKENATSFEDVYIGAAAVKVWGVKDCPFELKPWLQVADEFSVKPFVDAQDDARDTGSVVALWLQLGRELDPKPRTFVVNSALKPGQRDDGGWGKKAVTTSDLETTYRVMLALRLLKQPPKDAKKLRAFLDSRRKKDGGYATRPEDTSCMSATYYCIVVSKWLDDLEAVLK